MVNNLQITIANEYDLNQIDNLEATLSHRILTKSYLKKNMIDNNNYLLVAKQDGVITGYTSFSHLIDHIDIDSIVVDDKFRNQGIATALLQEIFNIALKLNVKEILLEVRISNNVAIHLYEKNGFKNIHTRKKYYPDNLEDALIYKKELA